MGSSGSSTARTSGFKRFSIEGTDVLVPMIDEAIGARRAGGARQVVIGMAHRGRLNVLTHVMGMSYVEMFGEFEGRAGRDERRQQLGRREVPPRLRGRAEGRRR